MVETRGEFLEEDTGLFRKRSNMREEIGNGGRRSYDLMDGDYRVFLEYIGAFFEGDLMQTGDREEDVGAAVSEDLVDSSPTEEKVEGAVSKELTDSSPNEAMVENVEGAVSKDLADSSTNEVVMVENVQVAVSKDLTDSNPSEVAVVETVEGAVSKDLADTSPNEAVVVENVELNENEMVLHDEECPDPHYKIFLDNVKEDGQFYVFENVREDGAIETILYEREDEDLGELMDVEAAELVAMSSVENLKEVDTKR